MRVDLYTTIHKGIRALLFDVATEAARIDTSSSLAVDGLVDRVEQAIRFLEEHAHHEDTHVMPALAAASPELARSLDLEHRVLDALQIQVEATAEALAAASVEVRTIRGMELARLLNQLTSKHLAHMGREELEANAVLWAAYDDAQLVELQGRIIGSIPSERYLEWVHMVAPALSPPERARMAAATA